MELIPHTRFPDMYLLEYETFSGAMAYQPCSRGIDIQGFSRPSSPLKEAVTICSGLLVRGLALCSRFGDYQKIYDGSSPPSTTFPTK